MHGTTLGKKSQKGVPVLDAETTSNHIKELRKLALISAMQSLLKANNRNSIVGNSNHGLVALAAARSRQSELRQQQSFDMAAVYTALSVNAGRRIHPITGKNGNRGDLCESGRLAVLSVVGLWNMGGIHSSLDTAASKQLYSFLGQFFGEDRHWSASVVGTLAIKGSGFAPYEHHEHDDSEEEEDDDADDEEEWQNRRTGHLKTLQEHLPKAVADCEAREEAVKSKSSDTDASNSEYEETKSSNKKKKGKSKTASGSGGGKRVSSTGEPTPGRPSSSDQSDAKKSATADKSGRKPLKNVTTNQWAGAFSPSSGEDSFINDGDDEAASPPNQKDNGQHRALTKAVCQYSSSEEYSPSEGSDSGGDN